MSWSASLPATPPEDLEVTLQALRPSPTPLIDEAQEQFDAARLVVADLVGSGAVGDGPVQATLSGHANPDHSPVEGFSNDCVTVSISQASQEAG